MRLLDVIGPVMIGPSSSHTAGAARIGRAARSLLGEEAARVVVGFHGSFANTYQGHGTDRAIIGGLMGFLQDDPRLCDSLALARAAGISYTFKEVRLRDAHPNTVTLDLTGASGVHVFVRAASLGGGAILIQEIDGLPVRVSGDAPTLIIVHRDTPGVIAKISGALADAGLNIANMQVSREAQGRGAISVLELDACASESTIAALRAQQGAGRSPASFGAAGQSPALQGAGRSPASFGAAGQSPALNDIIRVTWMCG